MERTKVSVFYVFNYKNDMPTPIVKSLAGKRLMPPKNTIKDNIKAP